MAPNSRCQTSLGEGIPRYPADRRDTPYRLWREPGTVSAYSGGGRVRSRRNVRQSIFTRSPFLRSMNSPSALYWLLGMSLPRFIPIRIPSDGMRADEGSSHAAVGTQGRSVICHLAGVQSVSSYMYVVSFTDI